MGVFFCLYVTIITHACYKLLHIEITEFENIPLVQRIRREFRDSFRALLNVHTSFYNQRFPGAGYVVFRVCFVIF
ncbi:hypothetical protein SAMN04515695_1547 [Pseudovibrio sp. Tun.PSC04-5.I4]|nr:hypothetical protein SAMN04515695_1547 [Pseudovibrio sp. Tun.PSC04-5.I4]